MLDIGIYKERHLLFISNNGKDYNNCGLMENTPCQSVDYAVRNVTRKYNTMILDGGQDKQMTYRLTWELHLIRNLTIQMLRGSQYKPIIMPRNETEFVFLVSARKISIHFHSMYFIDINVIYCFDLCDIRLINCKVKGKN